MHDSDELHSKIHEIYEHHVPKINNCTTHFNIINITNHPNTMIWCRRAHDPHIHHEIHRAVFQSFIRSSVGLFDLPRHYSLPSSFSPFSVNWLSSNFSRISIESDHFYVYWFHRKKNYRVNADKLVDFYNRQKPQVMHLNSCQFIIAFVCVM